MGTYRIQRAYDQIAEAYAERSKDMPEELIPYGIRMLNSVDSTEVILDLGCGHGRDTAWLKNKGAHVIGIDLSRGMLRKAREHAAVPLIQADMGSIPLRSESVAGIWCVASLLHLPKADAQRSLAEIHRVLRIGGSLFLSLQEGTGEGWETMECFGEVERLFARYQVEELIDLLECTGFQVMRHSRNSTMMRNWIQIFAQTT